MRCGFVPPEEHQTGLVAFPECEVCPGYSSRLPEVIEAARALSWSKRGGVTPLYGSRELPACAVDAIDVLEGAANKVERATLRAARDDVDGPRGHRQ